MKVALAFENAIEKHYAGVFPRVGAYIIDCAILFAGLIVWQAALYFVNPLVAMFRSGQPPTGTQLQLWVFATVTIPFLLYFALMLRSASQATLGMKFLKLKVVDLNGERISFGQALLRSALMLIPFELNHTVMFHLSPRNAPPSMAFWLSLFGVWMVIAIYIASISLTRRRQSVHDIVAGTVVEHTS